jgi:hypothetical protein
MISLILPYWNRQAAADKALAMLEKAYRDIDIEVIVVDDGAPEPFRRPSWGAVRVLRLPEKAVPKSPVTCWNEGARIARGDVLAISCVEVLHYDPVLPQMAAELERLGPKGYVLAACWCPDLREWHCHSTGGSRGAPAMPGGFGRAFLGLMHSSLYWEAGGWDEDYRDGGGWEDVDFAMRLQQAGAVPVIRDDLVVIHPKENATIHWPVGGFARNEALYARKWGARA